MSRIDQILSGLQSIVNEYSVAAVIWHAIFYFVLAALLVKWSPSNRLFGFMLCLPLLSVAFFAWLTGNPFNGSIFIIAAILIFIFSLKSTGQIETSQLIFVLSGVLMVAFGLIYPHFIKPDSVIKYFYASPVGLIPCPTLSILIGLALIFNGFGSQSVSVVLVIMGLFYGIFGVLKLAVMIDLFLIFGALMFLVKYLLSFRIAAT